MVCPPPRVPCWPARSFSVLAGACQFGTAWVGLRLIYDHHPGGGGAVTRKYPPPQHGGPRVGGSDPPPPERRRSRWGVRPPPPQHAACDAARTTTTTTKKGEKIGEIKQNQHRAWTSNSGIETEPRPCEKGDSRGGHTVSNLPNSTKNWVCWCVFVLALGGQTPPPPPPEPAALALGGQTPLPQDGSARTGGSDPPPPSTRRVMPPPPPPRSDVRPAPWSIHASVVHPRFRGWPFLAPPSIFRAVGLGGLCLRSGVGWLAGGWPVSKRSDEAHALDPNNPKSPNASPARHASCRAASRGGRARSRRPLDATRERATHSGARRRAERNDDRRPPQDTRRPPRSNDDAAAVATATGPASRRHPTGRDAARRVCAARACERRAR